MEDEKAKIGDTKPGLADGPPLPRLCMYCTYSAQEKAESGGLVCRLDPVWVHVGHTHYCYQFEAKLKFTQKEEVQ